MTMKEDFNQYYNAIETPPLPPGFTGGMPPNVTYSGYSYGGTDPSYNADAHWGAMGMNPAGEMLQERMADRQAGPLMPGFSEGWGHSEVEGGLSNLRFGDVTLPFNPDTLSGMLNFPSAAPASDMQDILRRGGNPVSDFARTTTMGTGYLPPVYEPIQRVGTPIGSMGIQNQPMVAPVVDPVVAPVFDPSSFANTLLPPANEEMLYGNRQDWTGPIADPFLSPWGGSGTPTSDIYNNYSNPNWIDVRLDRRQQRLEDMINFGQEYGAYALNPMAYLTNNLFDRFIR